MNHKNNTHSSTHKSKAPQTAVALEYDGVSAPKVSATGRHQVAEEIIRIAKEHEVPLYENPELVRLLATLELGDEIPEVLYRAIAQIIAFVYYLQGKFPEGFSAEDLKAHADAEATKSNSACTDLVIDKHQFINGEIDSEEPEN